MADTCEDCGRPKWDGGNALNVRECGARGSGTCQGFTEARRLRAELAAAKEEIARLTKLHRASAELNCNLVAQNCKLIERNRNLGDTAEPWSARAAVREIEEGSPKRPDDSDT